MSLLVVGTVAFDTVHTPFGSAERILGGAGTYASLSASYFGVKSRIVSVVGGDFPQKHIDLLKGRNVDLEGLQVIKDEKSFFWEGKYHNDMNTRDTLVTEVNVLEKFEATIPDSYKESDYLLLGNLHPGIQNSVLEQMNKRPKLVVMDTMNFWMDIAMDELKAVLKKIDVLTINDEEARQLSGEYSLVKAAKIIQKMGPKYLVIKKGEHGALLFQGEKMFYAPALPLAEVFDPTGAGDTFAGGFMGYLVKTEDLSFNNLKRAVIYGSAMASFTVEKFGTDRLIELTEEELFIRLNKFEKLTQFDLDL
ncbi:MAG: bifunctional hydroxymethylpyrimidine kinase/phosphomethylpyrimidine kinase [Flavobacteriales bacterium]|nr:bifunctional hydroxymethylpyrimidine kinase/phosphomethylpyrimidine kinase [Flavobacteriales bacterium]